MRIRVNKFGIVIIRRFFRSFSEMIEDDVCGGIDEFIEEVLVVVPVEVEEG
jgi:hypothetical protein